MVKHIRWFLHKKVIDKYQITPSTLICDLIAGFTVALVLIPQALAYAQLAGLPAYYGLYAALLPPVIAALFGSSRFVSTGPSAIVSLITGSALAAIGTSSVNELIMYAALLAFLVGIIQLSLGALRLGVIVNFISHPVILGFTNASAIIIATSQLPKMFGVTVDTYPHHYETLYYFIVEAFHYTHWMSIFMAVIALIIIYTMRRLSPSIPAILIAVVFCTTVSYYSNFAQKQFITLDTVASVEMQNNVRTYNSLLTSQRSKTVEKQKLQRTKDELERRNGYNLAVLDVSSHIAKLDFELNELNNQIDSYRRLIRSATLTWITDANHNTFYYVDHTSTFRSMFQDIWKIQVGSGPIDESAIVVSNGGSVIGKVPAGLPSFTIPKINIAAIPSLFNAALIISLLGFLQCIAVARSLAAKVGDRHNVNQELMGQGLANIAGAFSQSSPVSGSFALTSVNYNAGAVTVFASVFSSCMILLTLLFFTPILYYLPQPVLAAIILTSVVGLINFEKIFTAWRVQRTDGIVALVTLIATLFFAPELDKGLMIGVLLATGYYIYNRTRPRIVQLSADSNDILHDMRLYNLPPCKHIVIVRFDGSLFFANAAYLENKLEKIVNARVRTTKAIVLLADGINYIDYSGIETLGTIVQRYRDAGLDFVIAAMKTHILHVIKQSEVYNSIGESQFILQEKEAIKSIYTKSHKGSSEKSCPIKGYVQK